ncbi:hypothetical protein D9619_005074 [Psilocybe cf. subviscida]|uniref:Protein kinase domain-containing protein n=1 Tax=Psilocybe cf. subviscida TaxID=2480587 RepID=A0A8H5BQK4_9AGAR|nr:hypothetical protein D9619_005074 [Psilocybe cf. subviscida]
MSHSDAPRRGIRIASTTEIPAAVLEHLPEAMFGLKGLSGSQESGLDGLSWDPNADESDIAVLKTFIEAMYDLKGHSGSQEPDSDGEKSGSTAGDPDADDYDDLDYTDVNWTGGRYDYQEQKDFIKKIVLHSFGYKHDPKKTSKERYEERKRILNDRGTQHRRIFCRWPTSDRVTKDFFPPRDNVKGLAPPNAPAMWHGPGIWGATLFDFYDIHLGLVDGDAEPKLLFQTSGSKMLAWCLQNGETAAAPQMAWAMTEPDPELIEPCDIGELIRTAEHQARMFGGLPGPTPVLQQYLPQHLLPQSLIVHDPDQLLHTSSEKGSPGQQRYTLKFSDRYDERRKEDEAREGQTAAEEKRILEAFLIDPHTRNELPNGRSIKLVTEEDEEKEGPTNQQVFYVNPLRSARAPIKEAQLRISKEQFIGAGNHSFVYDASLVLPRTTFFESRLCEECIQQDIHAQLSTYNFSSSFFTSMVGKMVFKDESVPIKPQPKTTPGPPPQLRRVLSYEGPLVVLLSTVEYSHAPCPKHQPQAKPPPATAEVRVVAKLSKEADAHLTREAENYQRFPKYLFEHWSGLIKVPGVRNPVPAGPVVPQFYGYYVPDGRARENTEESTGGTNTSSDDSDKRHDVNGEHSGCAAPILSPILLLENCGQPIEPEDYGHDDSQECCSLVYRLRYAGFLHASVAQRNIVAQNGPLSAWPVQRNFFPGGYADRDSEGGPSGKCFRLIDFGRTEHVDALDDKTRDEMSYHDETMLRQWGWTRDANL